MSSSKDDKTPDTTPAAATTPVDAQAVLERFKKAYVNPEHYVVDAWLVESVGETWLKYQLSTDLADLEPTEMAAKMTAIPHEFEGLFTIITWFPKED